MSSLLDVLHKRPPRSQLALSDTHVSMAPPAPAGTETAEEELRLEGENQQPVQEQGAYGSYAAETTEMRRWSDQLAPAAPDPEPKPGSVQAPGLSAAHRSEPGQKTVLVALVAAAGLFAAFLGYQFAMPGEDSFLATPVDDPPPAAAGMDDALPLPEPPLAEQAPAVAREQASQAVPAEPESVAGVSDATSETGPETEPAWYDQPALPELTDMPGAARSEPPVIRISRGPTEDPLFEKLRTAYAALQAGAGARAEALYREVLASDPSNMDGVLGLASLAAQGGRMEEARELYRHAQRLDPKNSTAAAALSVLPGGVSGSNSESQLKSMLREQPESAQLHFALGLHYVADQRWPDAQLAFFEALRNDPTNADYAFNLAVSLDRLGQRQPAMSYYRRALDLAAGSQQFDPAAARSRLAVLAAPGS